MSEEVKQESHSVSSEVSKDKEINLKDTSLMSDANIKWRAKYKETRHELETIKARVDSEQKELTNKIESTLKEKQSSDRRYIESELKAQAIAAGLNDLDLVKLIDTSSIKMNEDGSLMGVNELISDFKSKKPNFFSDAKKISSSTNSPVQQEVQSQVTNAMQMSKEEWKKQRAKFKI